MPRACKATLHKLALVGALAASAAVPLSLATPAEAKTISGRCTVTPAKPVFAGFNASGVKQVRFNVSMSCDPSRSVEVQQVMYEEDWDSWPFSNADDNLGSRTYRRDFPPQVGSTTAGFTRSLPNTEDGNEEIYQKTRFRVISNGVTSAWTAWERTSYVSMPN